MFRDVTDAYAERYLAGNRWKPERFIRSFRLIISEHSKGWSILKGHGTGWGSWFEGLVESAPIRDELVRSVFGTDQVPELARSTFSPERSEKNIGKHIRFDDQSAIQVIGEAIGELVRT